MVGIVLGPSDAPINKSKSDATHSNFGGNRKHTPNKPRQEGDYTKETLGAPNREENPVDNTTRDVDDMSDPKDSTTRAIKREFQRRYETSKAGDDNKEHFHAADSNNRPEEDTRGTKGDPYNERGQKNKYTLGEGGEAYVGLPTATAPSITVHPVSQTKNANHSVTFSVAATGTYLLYQWKKNTVNINGATTSIYTIPSVSESDEGSYTCVVYNNAGTETSNAATLTVRHLFIVDTFTDDDDTLLTNHTPDDVSGNLSWSSTSSMKISSNALVNTGAVLTDSVTNGDMELNSGWATAGSPTTFEQSLEQAHGGTYSWKIIADSVGDGIRTDGNTFSITAGQLIKCSAWVYLVGPMDRVLMQLVRGDGGGYDFAEYFSGLATDQWVQIVKYHWVKVGGTQGDLRISAGEAGTMYVDDMKAEVFALNDPHATVTALDSADMWIQADFTLADNLGQGGVWLGSDPQNCIRIKFDRNNLSESFPGSYGGDFLRIEKVVAGVATQLYANDRVYEDGISMTLIKEASVSNNVNGIWMYVTDFTNNWQEIEVVTESEIIDGKVGGVFITENAGDKILSAKVKEIAYQSAYTNDGAFESASSVNNWGTGSSNIIAHDATGGVGGTGAIKVTHVDYLLALGQIFNGTGDFEASVRGTPYKFSADFIVTGGNQEVATKQEGTGLVIPFDASSWTTREGFGQHISTGGSDGDEWEIVGFGSGEVLWMDNFEYWILV